MKYNPCPVPNCVRNVIPGKSPHGLCIEHERWLEFLLFILPRIKTQPTQIASKGIILPGQPGFTMGQGSIKGDTSRVHLEGAGSVPAPGSKTRGGF